MAWMCWHLTRAHTGEYSGRDGLPQVFRRWAADGIAVHTYDCHGHGHSDPQEEWDRFLIWDFNFLVSLALCS